ncbi:LOW QUALITY PROTEIN: outer dense fiber protein 3-like [Lytechinus variegatus]|uniref:LOW QUALITY PROTEIN: outer dense fiber protein 3-like n=1 Tax=Lytechinus variegatus TaxID=7654 RepID=UPI001BB18F6F|nr:LOW QUALITY PROTEIN: outer dense fiber protein 3-like [Lytechinus variegatus]
MASDYTPTKPRGPIAASFAGPGPNVLLPTNIGQGTAITKRQMPIYSFGIRHKRYTTDCSPGPCHNYPSKVTRRGNDGTPHYSLYCRPKEITTFRTPGPGAYSPEKAGPSAHFKAAAYSLRPRTKGVKCDKSPAPNCYILPLILGGYSCVKPSGPRYSLRSRPNVGSFAEDMAKTPGPGSHSIVDPSIYKHKSPSYSMIGRNQMPCDSTRKPGPGAHSPEKVTVTKKSAPKSSFGIRHSEYITPLIEQTCD